MTRADLDKRPHDIAAMFDGVARRCGGRVVAPTVDGLGAEVVSDYLRTRR